MLFWTHETKEPFFSSQSTYCWCVKLDGGKIYRSAVEYISREAAIEAAVANGHLYAPEKNT